MVARFLLSRTVGVRFYNIPRSNWAGCADADGFLAFNLGTLGKHWVEQPTQRSVDALLLHELVHVSGVSDHLSSAFYNTLAQLGASLRHCPDRLVP